MSRKILRCSFLIFSKEDLSILVYGCVDMSQNRKSVILLKKKQTQSTDQRYQVCYLSA